MTDNMIMDLYCIVCERLRFEPLPVKIRRPASYRDLCGGSYRWTYVGRKAQDEYCNLRFVFSVGPGARFPDVAALVIHEIAHAMVGPGSHHSRRWKETFSAAIRTVYPDTYVSAKQTAEEIHRSAERVIAGRLGTTSWQHHGRQNNDR